MNTKFLWHIPYKDVPAVKWLDAKRAIKTNGELRAKSAGQLQVVDDDDVTR